MSDNRQCLAENYYEFAPFYTGNFQNETGAGWNGAANANTDHKPKHTEQPEPWDERGGQAAYQLNYDGKQ